MSELKPCPFCGNTEPEFERVGTPRQSCIVACGECGARHESSDEGKDSGASWNRRAQPAQAGQVLTDEEIDAAYEKARADYQRSRFAVRGQQLTAQDSPDWWFARAIEQAVMAKRVPQWLPIETAPKDGTRVILAWGGKSINGFYLDNSKTRTPWQGWRVESMVVQPSGVPDHWMPLPPPPGIAGEKGGA